VAVWLTPNIVTVLINVLTQCQVGLLVTTRMSDVFHGLHSLQHRLVI